MSETKTSEKKYTPLQKVAAGVGVAATAVGINYLAKVAGLPSDVDTEIAISEKKKEIFGKVEKLIEFQAKYLEEIAIVNSGNADLNKKIISITKYEENEVYRYPKADELKNMEAGLILAPNQIATLDIPDNASYLVDGKIKLGYYNTSTGEFSLLSEFTNYKGLDDSPKKVKSLVTNSYDVRKLFGENSSQYKLALINDGEGDVTVTHGSIEEIYTQAYSDYEKHGQVAVNIIDLGSEIDSSGDSIYPIANIKGKDIRCYTFQKLADKGLQFDATNLLGKESGLPPGNEFFITMENYAKGYTSPGFVK